jgi:hypothetical protein
VVARMKYQARLTLRGAIALLIAVIGFWVVPAQSASAAPNCGWGSREELGFSADVRSCLVWRGTYNTATPAAKVYVAAGYARQLTFCGLYWEAFDGSRQVAHGQASCTYNAQRGYEEVDGFTIARLQDVSRYTDYVRVRLCIDFGGARYWTWARYSV